MVSREPRLTKAKRATCDDWFGEINPTYSRPTESSGLTGLTFLAISATLPGVNPGSRDYISTRPRSRLISCIAQIYYL